MDKVTYSIEQKHENDKELDCLSCLSQVMDMFIEDLELEEISRVSNWFSNKYSAKNMYDKKTGKDL